MVYPALGHYLYGLQLVLLPSLLFITCMVCHGELVRLKPGVRHLTRFYLAVAAGGAAGGIFVALIAPQVFSYFLEFQLVLALAVVLLLVTLSLDPKSWIFRLEPWLPAAIAVGALGLGRGIEIWVPQLAPTLERLHYELAVLLVGGLTTVGALLQRRSATTPGGRGLRPVQLSVAALAIIVLASLRASHVRMPGVLKSSRNFYGTLRVIEEDDSRLLMDGRTLHGLQMAPPNDRFPYTYFAPQTGIGVLLTNHPVARTPQRGLRLGVVGLGAGALAAYGQPGDSIRFYEINPDVVELSMGDEPIFTFLRDSAASITVAPGDARLTLEREAASGQESQFDILVIDAFAGDAIPVHLLTREAFDLYWQQLDRETGVLAIHVTSRHVDLIPVLQGAAAYSHATYVITIKDKDSSATYSRWVLMSIRPGLLNIPALEPITKHYAHDIEPRLWTDDYSDIIRLLY